MEAVRLHQTHSLLSFSSNLCKSKAIRQQNVPKIKINTRMEVVSLGMLAPRKFMKKRRKPETFKSAEDEADQKNWRKLMNEISEAESAVSVLRTLKTRDKPLPRDLIIGTIMRFKQMKKWNLVSEILEWLKTQEWWSFNEKDHLLLITAYGKLGDFNKAERILKYMNDNGYAPSVISYTALMEAYGRSGHYNKAEAIFRRMESSGPEPSPLTYQILLKLFVQGDKFDEAEALFQSLIQNEGSPFKPDQKMFHMIIYMHKKAGNYDLARKAFAQMAERGIPMSTVTFNSLMSFEASYKEVSNIYDQMQRSGIRPDVVSYALLIKAYGKARREEEALAVFEEMLDAGVRPSRKAYNILLDAFAVSGMIEEARTVFKSMRRDRCAPDLCSYATMLSAYVNASDMSGAEKFFRRLTQDGFHPNVIIYGTLMKGYAKVNDLDNMMKTYETMRLAGIDANQTIFTTIMDAHGKASDFSAAAIWFKEMVARGFVPDRKARNILLSLAKSPVEQMEARQLAGLQEDEHAHQRHINGLRDVVDDDDDDDDDDDEAEEEYDDDGDDDTRVNSLPGLSSTTVK